MEVQSLAQHCRALGDPHKVGRKRKRRMRKSTGRSSSLGRG